MQKKIKITRPKPFEWVGAKFNIMGKVPKAWLETSFGIQTSLYFDLIDIKGRTVMGTSINFEKIKKNGWFSIFDDRIYFSSTFQFSGLSVGWIKESQGRMTIKLSGQNAQEQCIYIPVIVKQFEPKEGVDSEIKNKHGKIGVMIKQYEEDLKIYYQELEKIEKRRLKKNEISEEDWRKGFQYIHNWDVIGGVLEILDQAESFNKEYPFIQEDLEERQLTEKYKEALEWQGPLLHGLISKMDGFEFRIYSNDHGQHFHVIHNSKGINARFSFPEIKLIDYKSTKTSINRREQDRIIDFFRNPEIFKKLEMEFQRRDQFKNI
ncbi:MAG: hypothetical protein WCV73_03670 [Patescibacteria group bacterium]|jgi:hypothetical protein